MALHSFCLFFSPGAVSCSSPVRYGCWYIGRFHSDRNIMMCYHVLACFNCQNPPMLRRFHGNAISLDRIYIGSVGLQLRFKVSGVANKIRSMWGKWTAAPQFFVVEKSCIRRLPSGELHSCPEVERTSTMLLFGFIVCYSCCMLFATNNQAAAKQLQTQHIKQTCVFQSCFRKFREPPQHLAKQSVWIPRKVLETVAHPFLFLGAFRHCRCAMANLVPMSEARPWKSQLGHQKTVGLQ